MLDLFSSKNGSSIISFIGGYRIILFLTAGASWGFELVSIISLLADGKKPLRWEGVTLPNEPKGLTPTKSEKQPRSFFEVARDFLDSSYS